MPFSGGEHFPAVVCEVGSHSTKMGFAGEDYPRSYFRSTTAFKREGGGVGGGGGGSGGDSGDSASNSASNSNSKAFKRSYDFFSRGLELDGSDDGWEVSNPVDRVTGLIYQPTYTELPPPSSMNSNNDNADAEGKNKGDGNGNGDVSSSLSYEEAMRAQPGTTIPGECYTHFSSYLTHGYESALCTEPSSTPLLLVERSYNPPPIRQRMIETIFEEHNAPATFFARDAVCACYAVGRTTGTVVDIGHSGTVVTPVYDGFVENKGILRSPVGVDMMDKMILSQLDGLYKMKKARMKLNSPFDYAMPLYQVRNSEGQGGQGGQGQGHKARREPFHTLARLEFARHAREDGSGAGVGIYGYSSLHDLEGEAADQEPSDIYQQYANAPKASFKLPDGTEVDISQTKRFDISELMFGKGGKSAEARELAATEAKKELDATIASAGVSGTDGDTGTSIESSAIAQMEDMRRRKRNARLGNNKKKKATTASHEKLVKACTPYLLSAIGEISSSTIPSMICDAAFKCDRDQQSQLLGNAILCGGGACLSTSVLSNSRGDNANSMPERIREECETIIHAHTPGWRVKVLSPGLSERSICSWLGASIFGSLGSFHDMWVTKAEYEEHGAAIVNRKFP